MDCTLFDIGCQEIIVKNKRGKKTRSKIFEKILEFLHTGQYKNVIQFTNHEKNEFEVKLIDKKSRKWSKKDISLFLALDALSGKYQEQKNSDEMTKNRFKANMTKLVKSGYLEKLGSRKESKGVEYKKFRILKECPLWTDIENGYSPESTIPDFKESFEYVSESPVESLCSVPKSHYLCLSGESTKNVECINMLSGNGESISILQVANEKDVEVNGYAVGEVGQNLSSVNQYEGKQNWNSVRCINMLCESVASISIQPVVHKEVVEANGYTVGEVDQNLLSVNQYEGKQNCNSVVCINMLCGNERSISILPVVHNEIIEADRYTVSEVSQNLSSVNQYEGEQNCNSVGCINMLYRNKRSISILPVVHNEIIEADRYTGSEVGQNLSSVNQYEGKQNWNSVGGINMLSESEASISIQPVVHKEVVEANGYTVGEVDQNLSTVNQYEGKQDWNSVGCINMLCGKEESISILPVVHKEVVGANRYTVSEVGQNLSSVNQYEGKQDWNSVGCINMLSESEASISIQPVVHKEVVEANGYTVGEVDQNLSSVNQYEGEQNCNSVGGINMLCGKEESISILPVVHKEVVGANRYTVSEVGQNLSTVNQYEGKQNWNSVGCINILCRNERSISILPVVHNEIIEADRYTGSEVGQNLSSVNQYEGEQNCNSVGCINMLCGNERSISILPVVHNEIIEADRYTGSEVGQNLSSVNQYEGEQNCNSVGNINMLCENEESISILPIVHKEVVETNGCTVGEVGQNISSVNQYEEKQNWNKNSFDDAEMFEEIGNNSEILNNSTNPFLSSTVVPEDSNGWISNSNCLQENVYKVFSFDESMYDST